VVDLKPGISDRSLKVFSGKDLYCGHETEKHAARYDWLEKLPHRIAQADGAGDENAARFEHAVDLCDHLTPLLDQMQEAERQNGIDALFVYLKVYYAVLCTPPHQTSALQRQAQGNHKPL